MKQKKFNPHSKPYFQKEKPKENLPPSLIKSESIYDGYILEETEDYIKKIRIDSELNYDSCYYSSDTPSIDTKIYIETFSKKTIPNPNFEKEKEKYDKEYAQYKKELKEWNELKKIYDEEERIKNEEREKKLLLALKKKYEGV